MNAKPSVEILDAVSFEPIDQNGDGRYEALSLTLQIRLDTALRFKAGGTLMQGETVISDAPYFEDTRAPSTLVIGASGINLVTIRFSGEQIRRAGKDGSYQARVEIIGRNFMMHKSFDTPNYKSDLFGEN